MLDGSDSNRLSLWMAAHLGVYSLTDWFMACGCHVPVFRICSIGVHLSQDILQSAGVRRYKTEFISCPGCGRTLYNLQESVAKVKKAFAHLSRLNIAVMGCVVNGPEKWGCGLRLCGCRKWEGESVPGERDGACGCAGGRSH